MNDINVESFVKVFELHDSVPMAEQFSWIEDLETGRVIQINGLTLSQAKEHLFNASMQDPRARNISLKENGELRGAVGSEKLKSELSSFINDFRSLSNKLIYAAFPNYINDLKVAPTSYRPQTVQTRVQSIRADDRRLHIDSFPTRPNQGERILRVFLNVNPYGIPRKWRIGEPFEAIAKKFIPNIKPYSKWQANLLRSLRITKSLRSEYDHLMLGIHDGMKLSEEYQLTSPQINYEFRPGSIWICFSDQTAHAAMSGQFMLEQTYHLPVSALYNPSLSPLAILQKLTNKPLI